MTLGQVARRLQLTMSKPEGPLEHTASVSDDRRGHGMLISVRMPLSSALKLGLPADSQASEMTVTLTSVEFAGRLTLATGAIVTPEAVEHYVVAWGEASGTLLALVQEHGQAGLAAEVRGACERRSLWVPHEDPPTLRWLFCVLEAHYLSTYPGTDTPDTRVHQARTAPIGQALADLCEKSFPLAHHLWTLEETLSAPAGACPTPEPQTGAPQLIH